MRKKRNNKYTAKYYLETIILKLDKIEAEFEMMKIDVINNKSNAKFLADKVHTSEKRLNNYISASAE